MWLDSTHCKLACRYSSQHSVIHTRMTDKRRGYQCRGGCTWKRMHVHLVIGGIKGKLHYIKEMLVTSPHPLSICCVCPQLSELKN